MLNNVAFDRAEFETIARRVSGKQNLMLNPDTSPGFIENPVYVQQLEWFVGTPDPFHDIQGAYRWSTRPFLVQDLRKDLVSRFAH